MINLINGCLNDPQEKIIWTENKPSATIILNTHSWKEGEILIVGYKDKGYDDIMIGVGIKGGVGPDKFRIVIDRSVIIINEVLDYIPDVSYYVFDQRYLIKSEGKLILTSRHTDPDTGEISVSQEEINSRCVLIESLTGEIWICDPPKLISFFGLSGQITISDLKDLGGGQVKIGITGIDGKIWDDLYFVAPDEKRLLTEMVFDKNFEVSIAGQKFNSSGAVTTSNDPCVVVRSVYTLTARYAGAPINLDVTPTGWTKSEGTGVYTKTVLGNMSSSSGRVDCKLTVTGYEGSKSHSGVSLSVGKYVFIVYSPTDITSLERHDLRYITTSASGVGTIKVVPPQDSYVWFAFPNNMKPTQITQLGVSYVQTETKIISGVTKDGVDLGGYTIYRSLNPGNGETQEITVK